MAAGIGLEEDGKAARMQTGDFKSMTNQRFCFIFVFCKQNSSRPAVNLVVAGEGKGWLFRRLPREEAEARLTIMERFNVPVEVNLPVAAD